MMFEDTKLMVLTFPGDYQKFKAQPVEHNALAISSLLRAKFLTDNLWVQDGVPTNVKICIAPNVDNITFILKFCDILNEKDIKLTMNPIQAAKIDCA